MAGLISIRVEDHASRVIRQLPETIARGVVRWRNNAKPFVENAMKGIIMRKRNPQRPGNQLAPSVQSSDLGVIGFEVGPQVDYALFVDQPTRAHDIFPRHGKVLAFPPFLSRGGFRKSGEAFFTFQFGGRKTTRRIGKGGAFTKGIVFTKHVRHPGTRGFRFIEETTRTVSEPVRHMLSEAIDAEILQLQGQALRGVFGRTL